MGKILGNAQKRANIVWYKESEPLRIDTVVNTDNTEVIYALRDSDGALLSYIPGISEELQGFTEFTFGGYWILAKSDYELPGIVQKDEVAINGALLLGDFEGSIEALETAVGEVINQFTASIPIGDFEGSIDATEIVVPTVTTFNIEFPQQNQTFQYDNTQRTGDIRIKGSYLPNTATVTIEAKYNTNNWEEIGTANGGTFDLVYKGNPGQKTLEIRPKEENTLFKTITTVGVGEILIVAGDSYASGRILVGEDITYVNDTFVLTYLANDGQWKVYTTGTILDAMTGTRDTVGDEPGRNPQKTHWAYMAQEIIKELNPPRPIAFQMNPRGGATAGVTGTGAEGTGLASTGSRAVSWLPNAGSAANRRDRSTLYGSMLSRFEASGNTQCRAVIAHLGTNDLLQGDTPDDFITDLIAFGDAIFADFNCRLYVPIITDFSQSGDTRATKIDSGETLARYILFQQRMRVALEDTNNNVYFGGDLSGLVPDSNDKLHIATALKGKQMGDIWKDALINFLEAREPGVNALTGTLSIGDFEGSVESLETQDGQILGTISIGDFEGTVSSDEIDLNQQLLDKALALWQFDDTDNSRFIDEKNNIQLNVVTGTHSSSNKDENIGGRITQGTGPNAIPTLKFDGGDHWLKSDQAVNNLLPTSDNKRTYVFWLKLNNRGTTDTVNRTNFFNAWESPGATDALFSFDADFEVNGNQADLSKLVYRWFVVAPGPSDIVYKSTELVNITEWVLCTITWDGTQTSWAQRSEVKIKSQSGTEILINPPITTNTGNIRSIEPEFNTLRIGNGFPSSGWGNRVIEGEMGPFYIFDSPLTIEEYNYFYNNGIPRQVSATLVPKGQITGSISIGDFEGVVTSDEEDEIAFVSPLKADLLASWSLTTDANDISGKGRHLTINNQPSSDGLDFGTNGVTFPSQTTGTPVSHLSRDGIADLITGDSFTYSFIATIKDKSPNQNFVKLWDFDNRAGDKISTFTCDITTDRIRFVISTEVAAGVAADIAKGSLSDDTQYLVILIYDRANNKHRILMRNSGRADWLEGNGTMNIVLPKTTSPLVIGSWQPFHSSSGQWRNPTGPIKFVNLWNRAITDDVNDPQSEVNLLYNNGNFITYPF